MKTNIPLITIGLDPGDKKHAICVLNQGGTRTPNPVLKIRVISEICGQKLLRFPQCSRHVKFGVFRGLHFARSD